MLMHLFCNAIHKATSRGLALKKLTFNRKREISKNGQFSEDHPPLFFYFLYGKSHDDFCLNQSLKLIHQRDMFC